MANKDTNSNKTPAKTDWEKAKKILYQAEADILVNKPIPHYNKLSHSFDTSELAPLIASSFILGTVSAFVIFSGLQGNFPHTHGEHICSFHNLLLFRNFPHTRMGNTLH